MNESKLTKNKTIRIVGSVFLTFLMYGLGQISCGKIRRGFIIYIAHFLVTPIAIFLCFRPIPPFNIAIAALFYIGFFVFVIIDAFKIARNPENTLRLKPLWGYILLIALWQVDSQIISNNFNANIKSNYIQAFQIPSGAMIPTLLIGDYLLVDKAIYKKQDPQRGDIVVFPYPLKPEQDFIKRVVAIAGDEVEIKDKQLFVNGKKIKEDYIVHKDPGVISKRDNFGPVNVPEKSLFLMGDNRDNSHDSRFWGFVDKNTVRGKAINLYWSRDRELGKTRWSRIGKQLQ